MENIVLDRSGLLKKGYFYEIFVRDDEDFLIDEKDRDSWIVSQRNDDGDYVRVVQEGTYAIHEQKTCSLNEEHLIEVYHAPIPVRLIVGEDVTQLTELDGNANVYVLVTSEFAKRIEGSRLTGYRFSPVVLDREELKRTPNFTPPDFLELQFMGRKCFRPLSVVGAPNECPFCGTGPIICNECGHTNFNCVRCGKAAWKTKKFHGGPTDPALLAATWDNWSPAIIDVERWDGTDFIYGSNERGLRSHIVTKRTVDWLLSVHATQFFAKPALANIEGITERKSEMLALAKDINSV